MFEIVNKNEENPIKKITIPEISEGLIIAIETHEDKDDQYYTMSYCIDSKNHEQYQFNGLGFTMPRTLAVCETKAQSITKMINNGFRVFTCKHVAELADLINEIEMSR